MGDKKKLILKKNKIKKKIKELEKLYKLNPKKTYINKMFKLREKISMIGGVKKKPKKNKSKIKSRLGPLHASLVARPVFQKLNTRTHAFGEKYPIIKFGHTPAKSSFKQNLQEKKVWMKYRLGKPIEEGSVGQYEEEQTVGFNSSPKIKIFQGLRLGRKKVHKQGRRPTADYLGGFFLKKKPSQVRRPHARPRHRTQAERHRVKLRHQTSKNEHQIAQRNREQDMINMNYINKR